MTVQELIEELQEYDPNKRVYRPLDMVDQPILYVTLTDDEEGIILW